MAMKNIGGAYCYRVKGLFVPYITPETIDRDINNYISDIERQTARLEDSYNKNDVKGFISASEAIHNMLLAVYANQCISHTRALIDAAEKRGIVYCGRLMQQAIADFLLLSIDMQKAQALGISPAIKYKNVERNEEVAKNLSAIGRLLEASDHENAKSIAVGMKEIDDSFATLAGMIDAREYGKAKDLAGAMEKEHIGLIKNVNVSHSKKTILAVDDRPDILANVNAALKDYYKVLGAPVGKIALEIMAKQKIDLFYLDIEMPEMDGFELTRRIRADRVYKDAPIIFLTGNASRENITKAIRLGVNDFIVKPSNHINLLVKARKHMDELN